MESLSPFAAPCSRRSEVRAPFIGVRTWQLGTGAMMCPLAAPRADCPPARVLDYRKKCAAGSPVMLTHNSAI